MSMHLCASCTLLTHFAIRSPQITLLYQVEKMRISVPARFLYAEYKA